MDENRVITSSGLIRKYVNNFSIFQTPLIDSDYFPTILTLLVTCFLYKIANLRNNDYLLGLTQDHLRKINEKRDLESVNYEEIRNIYTIFNKQSKNADENECPICYEFLSLPVKTNCRHVFCSHCIFY